MVSLAARLVLRPAGTAAVLYDGMCGPCGRFVEFASVNGVDDGVRFYSMHGDRGRRMLGERYGPDPDLDTMYAIVHAGGDEIVLTRSSAALFVVGRLAWPWRCLYALRLVPRGVRDAVYDCIRRNRLRMSGGCSVVRREGAMENDGARASERKFLFWLIAILVVSAVAVWFL